MMKAIGYTKSGPPDVLQLKEVETPKPKDNEVLVKIQATSLNAADLDFLKGRFQPSFFRKSGFKILGSDIAGRIKTIGRNVTQFYTGNSY